MLQNRIYVGEIVHQGNAYQGLHKAIVEPALWEQVQDRLTANRADRATGTGAMQPSLLAGRIVDGEGRPMTPTHAVKKGKRYRYYISNHTNRTERTNRASSQRIPAGDIEALVSDRLRSLFASQQEMSDAFAPFNLDAEYLLSVFERADDLAERWMSLSTTDVRNCVRIIVVEVAVRNDMLRLQISRSGILEALDLDQLSTKASFDREELDDLLVLDIECRLARAGKGVRLVIGGGRANKVDPGLANLIGEAFRLRSDLLTGADDSIETMSARMDLSKGYLTSRIRLTYLAPGIVHAILDGEQPAEMSATRLLAASKDLPLGWAEQLKHLGFANA